MKDHLPALDNLVKSGGLKHEPFDQDEFAGLIHSAKRQLRDAAIEGLSDEGRFSFLYGAAHSLGVAALRFYGYRPGNRFVVFQSLPHTVNFRTRQWRVLDACHRQRNLAEYEGQFDVSAQVINELRDITEELLSRVEALESKGSE